MSIVQEKATAAKLIACLKLLEKLSFELYHKIALKTKNPRISWISEYIAYDSWKHYLLYDKLIEAIGGEEKDEKDLKCGEILGKRFVELSKRTSSIIEELDEREIVGKEELEKIMEDLTSIEVLAGEETYMRMVSAFLKKSELASMEPGVSIVFELIEEDEKEHEELLERISLILNE